MGFEAMQDYAPKLLTKAYVDFLSDDKAKCGTNAGERKKATWRSWFKRFANAQRPGMLVHEVTGKHVIEHLSDFQAGKLAGQTDKPTKGTVKEVAKSLCSMLEHQTSGTFRKVPVKAWVKKHLNGDSSEIHETPYWLDQRRLTLF